MQFQRLVQAAVVGILFSVAGAVLAQGTMESRPGSRHVGPGAVDSSTSTFAVGVTLDGGASFVSSAGLDDTVEIRGEIRPEADNIGQPADIFVVDRLLGGGFLMRDQSGAWIPWDVSVDTLVPFREGVLLDDVQSIDMFSGTLGRAGEHAIFLGYLPPDGILRYHTSGLPVTITETSTQTPLEQAEASFESTINPNVVPFCLDCHVAGGAAHGLAQHVFVHGSSDSAIDTNFNQLRSLLSSRGKAYILAKVRGENAHVGGMVLSSSSQQYRDLQSFLELLEQL